MLISYEFKHFLKNDVKKWHVSSGEQICNMHHFRSGFLIVVTDVWTRSLLTPVSWFHYQFAATLCLFFYCYKWLLRAQSSSGRFQWRATFITFLSTQHTPSRVPQDAARNAAPQSTSSWTAFFHTFWYYFSWMRKIKTNLTYICTLT